MMHKSARSEITSFRTRRLGYALSILIGLCTLTGSVLGAEIIHDAEHLIIAAQHSDKWLVEDTEIDALLAGVREKHGGKPPSCRAMERWQGVKAVAETKCDS